MDTGKQDLDWLYLNMTNRSHMTTLRAQQILKYVLVGVFINGFGYLFFLWLLLNGIDYKISASISYVVGVVSSFFLNRRFVFNNNEVAKIVGFFRHIVVVFGGYVLNILTLTLFVNLYDYNPEYVQVFSVIMVSFYFFILNKIFVHKRLG